MSAAPKTSFGDQSLIIYYYIILLLYSVETEQNIRLHLEILYFKRSTVALVKMTPTVIIG